MIEYPEGFSQPEMKSKPICGVLAVAIAAQVPYPVALAALKRNMPEHRKRWTGSTYPEQQQAALSQLGVKFKVTLVGGWKLGELIACKLKPGVTYLVTVRGHIMTVKDGMICDQSKNLHYTKTKSANRKVLHHLEILGKGW